MAKKFLDWAKEKNENFDDFNTQIQSDELKGRQNYEAKPQMNFDFKNGMTLNAREIALIQDLVLNSPPDAWDEEEFANDPTLLSKLQTLGFFGNL